MLILSRCRAGTGSCYLSVTVIVPYYLDKLFMQGFTQNRHLLKLSYLITKRWTEVHCGQLFAKPA